MIGIIGGIGPMAGIDLYKRVVEQTVAHRDQDHVPVLLASIPHEIVDRTEYLLGKTTENPASALARIISLLEHAGATQIGIACNTAHAPRIFDPMCNILRQNGSQVQIAHLIQEAVRAIREHPADIRRVGLLSTSGTYQAKLYQNPVEAAGLVPIMLDFQRHDALVHSAIYDPDTGLKAIPEAHLETVIKLNTAIAELQSLGAEAVVLGCTEIGMVEEELDFQGMTVFNPNTLLARELVRRIAPEKLKD